MGSSVVDIRRSQEYEDHIANKEYAKLARTYIGPFFNKQRCACYLLEGHKYEKAGKYDEALKFYQRAASEIASYVDGHDIIGRETESVDEESELNDRDLAIRKGEGLREVLTSLHQISSGAFEVIFETGIGKKLGAYSNGHSAHVFCEEKAANVYFKAGVYDAVNYQPRFNNCLFKSASKVVIQNDSGIDALKDGIAFGKFAINVRDAYRNKNSFIQSTETRMLLRVIGSLWISLDEKKAAVNAYLSNPKNEHRNLYKAINEALPQPCLLQSTSH